MKIIGLLVRIIIVVSLLCAGYYAFWLRPQLLAPRALLTLQKYVGAQHSQLLQHRLALVGLAQLSPVDQNFASQKASLLSVLQRALEINFGQLDQALPKINIKGVPSGIVNFLTEWNTAGAQLKEEQKSILAYQRILLGNLQAFDAAVNDIYRYDPRKDLLVKDIAPVVIHQRLKSAGEALVRMQAKIERLELISVQKTILNRALQKTVLAINNADAENDLSSSSQSLQEVVTAFAGLPQLFYEAEMTYLTSPETVTNITAESNLILKYDHWLKRAQAWQVTLTKERRL